MKKIKCSIKVDDGFCRGTIANLYDDGKMDTIEVIRGRGKNRPPERVLVIGKEYQVMAACGFHSEPNLMTLSVVDGKLVSENLRIVEGDKDGQEHQQQTKYTEPGASGAGSGSGTDDAGKPDDSNKRQYSSKREPVAQPGS